MDIEQMKKIIEDNLSNDRYEHTLRVTEVAIQLADVYNAPRDKVQYAALLHDLLKEKPPEQLANIIRKADVKDDILTYHHALWHGPAAAIVIQEQFGVTDRSIIEAVRYHTTGRPDMGLVEQIIFIADYIEPARSFPGIEDVRKLAFTHLQKAICMSLANTIIHLVRKEATIYPKTMYAYNAFTMKKIYKSGGKNI